MKPEHRTLCYQAAQAVAIAAAVFLLLAGGRLAFNQVQGKLAGFVNSQDLSRLQAELKKTPKDEALKQRIRQLDLALRRDAFAQLTLSHNVTTAMIWAAALFLASAHFVRVFHAQLPNPLAWGGRQPAEERQGRRRARYAVAAVFGFVAAAGVAVSVHPVQLPERRSVGPETIVVAEPPPTALELAANWSSFRGPAGANWSREATAPTGGDRPAPAPTRPAPEPFGRRVIWKTEVPLPGLSSPVRWGNAIFLTGANKAENRVFRFDADTGQLVWSALVRVPQSPKPGEAKISDDNSYAAPTPVTDGRRVYAVFANGDVAAFGVDRNQVWAKNLGLPETQYGYAASPALWRDKLLIQYDQGYAGDGRSKLLALDTRTGQEVWSVERAVASSWASPVVIEVDGQPQVITCADPWVIAYNPADGGEIWKVNCLNGDVAPSPLFAGGLVVAVSPEKETVAIRPTGQGDVTATHIAWRLADGAPGTSSPASDGQRLYLYADGGALTCVDLATGKVKWTENLGGDGYATPVVARNGVVVVSHAGNVVVVGNGDTYEELDKAKLGERSDATPLLHGPRMYVRGRQHLFCIQADGAIAGKSE